MNLQLVIYIQDSERNRASSSATLLYSTSGTFPSFACGDGHHVRSGYLTMGPQVLSLRPVNDLGLRVTVTLMINKVATILVSKDCRIISLFHDNFEDENYLFLTPCSAAYL